MNSDQEERRRALSDLGHSEEALERSQTLAFKSCDPLEKAGYLLEQAHNYQRLRQFKDAEPLVTEARRLVAGNVQASGDIDLFHATLLLDENRRSEGLQVLSRMLTEYGEWLKSPDGRDLYERVQIQRAFSLMHLSKNEEARPILEEAPSFKLNDEDRSHVHCHLGRCYHELSLYTSAKAQFELAQTVGVTDDWQATFHYYYGYTLYALKEFRLAKREFILCLQAAPSGPPPPMRYAMLAAVSRKLGEHDEARLYEKMEQSDH